MRKISTFIIILIASMVCVSFTATAQTIVRKNSIRSNQNDSIENVIVGNDTVCAILPEPNFGRFDRGLFNRLFIPKGRWGFGLTASYGELNTEDVGILSVIKDVDLNGKMFSIKPYLSYFVKNNQAVGLRFNYTRGTADLGNLALNFDDDLNFAISGVSYYSQSFAVSAFYRTYIGLDAGRRFSIFNEVDLSFGSGSSRFKRLYNNMPKDTKTVITEGALNFSPGLCVFLHDLVSFNVSFGVFGLKFKNEKQITDGVYEGSRWTSGANFRFNIFNINFGLMVVI